MKNFKAISAMALLAMTVGLSAQKAHAYGTGLSTYPLEVETKLISAELTGITSQGGGLGMQARFTDKLSEKGTIDAGLGISGGERSARLFAGYDYELFPDYENQPRTSLKAFVENSKEFNARRNIIGLAPSVSKGFTFWGKEAFPYLSIPYGISLNGNNSTYSTTLSANIGISGVIPADVGPTKQLTANAEAIIGLKDSFSGVFFGVAYPIE
ncbi:MAG: hypothetical protein H7281_13040 [Bacteriovorax sp.]|nr:hypothetical protein [Bacteriovorax sp.]